jgi:hypothetical protein
MGSTPEAAAPLEPLAQRKEAKTTRNTKRPEQDDRRHPRHGTNLRQCGDSGCGKSPDAARLPLSIADEGAEVTILLSRPPKFFHFRHKHFYKRW